MSPDPYMASGGPADPGSWNRYAYVGGDPIKYHDPEGLLKGCPKMDGCAEDPLPDPFKDSRSGDIGDGMVETEEPQNPTGQGPSRKFNRDLLLSIKDILDNALSNSDCASIFGKAPILKRLFGAPTAQQVLDSLIQGDGKYGSIKFTDDPLPRGAAAQTTPNSPIARSFGFAVASTVTITTLELGAGFFNNSTFDAELTILHELGHVLYNLGWSSTIVPDINPPDASDNNDSKIKSACGKYLK